MRVQAILVALIWLVAFSSPTLAQKKSSLRTDQIRGEYAPPKDAKHQALYEELQKQRVLERLRELLSPLRLPRRLTLKLESCDGVANAYYQEDTVTVCYEYLEYIQQNAPKEPTAFGLTPTDFLVGPTMDVFLHEVGHAVFDMLEVPVLGREEDAADLFSAYVLLQFAPSDAKRLILGVAFLGAKDAKESLAKAPEIKAFADSHGLPAQRYFNVLCIAYGFDPKAYAEAVTRGGLPEGRAEGCADEYAVLDNAFRKLISPYVSKKVVGEVRPRVRFKWSRPK